MPATRSSTLLAALAVICLALLQGSDGHRRKCRCLKLSNCIHPKSVAEIQIIPKTAVCQKVEIVITTNSKEHVCVDPNTACIKRIIQRFARELVSPTGPTTEEMES